MPKYQPLRDYLCGSTENTLQMTVAQIESLIGAELPDSAWEHREWWANDRTHVQARAWLDAGWYVFAKDLDLGTVTFNNGRLSPSATIFRR